MFHVIDLPCEVDLSKAKASFNDGRLEVVMPKAAPARSVRVETKQGCPQKVVLLSRKQVGSEPQEARRLSLSQRADRQGANSIVEEIASALAGELEGMLGSMEIVT